MRRRPKYDDILTPREWEVVELLNEGLTNEEIAERLNVSFGTAKYHVGEVLSKLGASNRQEAVRLALKRKASPALIPWFPLPNFQISSTSRNFWRIAGGAVIAATASVVLIGGIFFGWGASTNARPDNQTNGIVGLDIAPEELQALEQARLSTPYKRTILLAKGELSNLGTDHALFASLPRVETLRELQAVLTKDINLVVIDQSAMEEIEGTDFWVETWQDGRGLMGLNLCFADLPESLAPTPVVGSPVWETSPSGETRYYDTILPEQASMCSWASLIADAGYAYLSFVPRSLTLDEQETVQTQGERSMFRGPGVGRFDRPPESQCFVQELLTALDAGSTWGLFLASVNRF